MVPGTDLPPKIGFGVPTDGNAATPTPSCRTLAQARQRASIDKRQRALTALAALEQQAKRSTTPRSVARTAGISTWLTYAEGVRVRIEAAQHIVCFEFGVPQAQRLDVVGVGGDGGTCLPLLGRVLGSAACGPPSWRRAMSAVRVSAAVGARPVSGAVR
jgi:hypothetical protein